MTRIQARTRIYTAYESFALGRPSDELPEGRSGFALGRSYLTSSMQICATTCRNGARGKTTFLLQELGWSGEAAVRKRSLFIKEPPRRPPLLRLLATF